MTTRSIFALAVLLTAAFFAGCKRGTDPGAPVAEAPPAEPAAAAPPAGQAAVDPAPATPPAAAHSGSHVGDNTREVLDVQEKLKDPNWTVVAREPSEVQGFTFAGTAYNRAAALSGTVGLEQWIQHQHAQSERGTFPTYAELQQYVTQNGVDMPRMREYHHYGYDATTGQIVVLENKAEKEGRRAELGLSPNDSP